MYIEYQEYSALGGNASEAEFPRLEKLAEKKLNYWTMDRITDVNDDVKLCMILIINGMYDVESSDMENVSSFSNDGVSVSLSDPVSMSKKMESVYNTIIEILPVELVSRCV